MVASADAADSASFSRIDNTEPRRSRLRRIVRRAGAAFGFARAIGLVLLAALIALRIWDPAPLETLRLKAFDLLQNAAPRQAEQKPVVIVDIDEPSLVALGQWPWPRTVLAQMIRRLGQMGAVAIGFDIVFAEPDRTSPDKLAMSIPGLRPETRRELAKLPSNDQRFATMIQRGRIVLGQTAAPDSAPIAPDRKVRKTAVARIGGDPRPYLFSFPGLVLNIETLDAAAAGRGMFTLKPDRDGIVRRVPAVLRVGDTIFPTLAVEMLRVATGQRAFAVKTDQAGPHTLSLARQNIPIDRQGRIWVHYAPHDRSRYVSAAEVIAGKVPPQRVAGHLVLVGTSAAGLFDLRATPLAGSVPGVEVHAQLLESLITGYHLVRPHFAFGLEVVAVLVLGLLFVIVLPMVAARWTILLLLLVLAGLGGASAYFFTEQRFLVDASYPIAVAVLLYMVIVYAGHARSERQRQQVRGAFGQYLSPVLVERLARDPDNLKLGGELRTMTFMFADIRGFTTISEEFQDDPAGLTGLINRFLTPMSDTVMREGGTVDKYMGDCIMAFWNAPLDDPEHARHACRAALTMNRELDALNERLRREAVEQAGLDEAAGRHDAYREAKALSEGVGGTIDHAKAFALFRQEAEQGFANAQYNLGKAYRDGLGVGADPREAARWFNAAAEQGYAKAMRHIGVRLIDGDGIAADPAQGLMWLTLAAQQGLSAAEERRQAAIEGMTATEIGEAMRDVRAWRPKFTGLRRVRLEMGIGMNSGPCIAGNMGSEQRFDYSVLGDAVNLASRLEAQSKNYGTGIVISEDTRDGAPELAALELDLIAVKGKREAVRIFALLGDERLAASPGFRALNATHEAMLAAYRGQNWEEALRCLEACESEAEGAELDDLYDLYRKRIDGYRADPPGAYWDGVFVAETK